jgi:putative transposase
MSSGQFADVEERLSDLEQHLQAARPTSEAAEQVLAPPWLFGHRLREAGLMGSLGKVACAYGNALMESFWGSMQIELLDRRSWTTRAELASAEFEWIEAFYNPSDATPDSTTAHPSRSERLHKTANPAA